MGPFRTGLTLSVMWVLSGFLVGFPLGFVLHRSDFCMHSALREALGRRPGASVQAYLLALGLQLVIVNGLGGLGLLRVSAPPVQPVAAAVGGLVFGLGMVLAKG